MGSSNSKKSQSKRQQDTTIRDEVDLVAKAALEAAGDVELETKVQISVSIEGISPLQSYCTIGYMREGQDDWICIGGTETSMGSSMLSFVHTMVMDYTFESPQRVRLDVYTRQNGDEIDIHVNEKYPKIPEHVQFVGRIDCFVAEVLSSPGSRLRRSVGDGGCMMTVFIDELKILQNLLKFDIQVASLQVGLKKPKKKPRNFYFSMYRSIDTEEDNPLGETVSSATLPQVVKTECVACIPDENGFVNGLFWSGITVSVNSLCRGVTDAPIKIELWESLAKGSDIPLTSCSSTYRMIEASFKSESPLDLHTSIGAIKMHSISIERRETFLDYVSNGLEISLFIGIDFTKSNKDAHLPTSLHYMPPGGEDNDYLRAIRSVVEILEHYDSDKKFPVYGFGAKLPPSFTHVSHCFACNGDFFAPEVVGVEGVAEAYKSALSAVALHGPTNFHDIISLVADNAEPYSAPKPGQQLRYSILLILTDGVITDMKQTVNEIVRGSDYPMSIIIVGVGEEDFGLMQLLDADDKKLYSTTERRFANRDIVQFVPFSKFHDLPVMALARETLEEIPREVVDYFKNRNILSTHNVSNAEGVNVFEEKLNKMKDEFVSSAVAELKEIDDLVIYKIVNEDKVPAIDCGYLIDVAKNAHRGSNVLTLSRHTTSNGNGDIGDHMHRTVRESAQFREAQARSCSLLLEIDHPPGATETFPNESSEALPGLCKVCFDRPIETVLLPCGHSLMCLSCSATVGSACPMCRVNIVQVVRTFSA